MIPVFIPYVNRPDMLDRVISMIPRTEHTEAVIINNSGGRMERPMSAALLEPPVPLSFTQSQNWMMKLAKAYTLPFYMWAHCDALLEPDSVEKLYQCAVSQTGKWGVIYTHYDIFCAYNTEAADAVGGYDTDFFDYSSDCDFYRRLDLAGYKRIESGIPVGHDKGSTTITSDKRHWRRVGIQVPYRSALYRAKWGGEPGHETFKTPYDEVK